MKGDHGKHTRTHTHTHKTFLFLTNEYIHNVDAQMETLTPKPHHKDTSEHDLSHLLCGYKIICNIYNIIKMPVLLIENNLKFKFTNGDILK